MKTTIVVGKIVLATSTADLSQNRITSASPVARIAPGTSMGALNPLRTSDEARIAPEMSMAVLNQNPIAAGADGRVIMAAKAMLRAKAVGTKIGAGASTVPEASGKDEPAPAVVSEMTTTTGRMNGTRTGHRKWARDESIDRRTKDGVPRGAMANANFKTAARWEWMVAPPLAIEAMSDSKAAPEVGENSPNTPAVVLRAIAGPTNASRKT